VAAAALLLLQGVSEFLKLLIGKRENQETPNVG